MADDHVEDWHAMVDDRGSRGSGNCCPTKANATRLVFDHTQHQIGAIESGDRDPSWEEAVKLIEAVRRQGRSAKGRCRDNKRTIRISREHGHALAGRLHVYAAVVVHSDRATQPFALHGLELLGRRWPLACHISGRSSSWIASFAMDIRPICRLPPGCLRLAA